MLRQFTYVRHDDRTQIIMVHAHNIAEANVLAEDQGASFHRCHKLGLLGGECGSPMWYVKDAEGTPLVFSGVLIGRFLMRGRSYMLVDTTTIELPDEMAEMDDDQIAEFIQNHQDEDYYEVRVLARFNGEFELNPFWKGGLYIDD